MTMRWEKRGLIFQPDARLDWQRSHAALPVPVRLDDRICRVFFASRDSGNRSHIGSFDIDLDKPECVIDRVREPLLNPGPMGYFDDHGIYAASAVWCDRRLLLYTIGWSPGVPSPLFYASVGLAVSEDGGRTFRKHGNAPVMTRSEHDPSLVTSPFVLREGGRWRMWYVSGQAWEQAGETLRSRYDVKYAESSDGVDWRRDGLVCLGGSDPAETNIARTCVVQDSGTYRAWFSSSRGEGYRIGEALSDDGVHWRRIGTPAGLEPSVSGWDSEAMAYPNVIRHKEQWLMFYNGNGFGRDGVGLAVARAWTE